MKILKIFWKFILKALETIIGSINTVLQYIGWLFYIPGAIFGIISGSVRGNYWVRENSRGWLLMPFHTFPTWIEGIKGLWTDWD